MAIKITVDGNTYDGIDVITVGGKVLALAYVEDSTGGDAGGGSGGTTAKTYTITNNLTNCSNSNKATTITEKTAYTGVITANDGYELEDVTVTMGGSAVGASNGIINIHSVTDNIVITATAVEISVSGDALPTNGLLSYFDLRNLGDKANVAVGTTKGVTATQGNGALFSWAGTPVTSSDEYGAVLARPLLYSSDGSTNQTDMGSEYSVCLMVYGGAPNLAVENSTKHTTHSNITLGVIARPAYNTSSGINNVTDQEMYTTNAGYTTCVMTVAGSLLKMYFNGQLKATYDGTDYTDFKSWASTVGCGTIYNNGQTTAYAVYNRALTEAESVEAMAFMNTLEVVS